MVRKITLKQQNFFSPIWSWSAIFFKPAIRYTPDPAKFDFSPGPVRPSLDPCSSLDTMHTSVAVDCIALNYWGKHKRKMAIRGIN